MSKAAPTAADLNALAQRAWAPAREAAAAPATRDLPLAGLRVLDLSQGIAGPYCGLVLRQQGAQVIKVEPPTGDWSRNMGRQQEGLSAIFLACNAGKSGLTIDASTPQGKAQLQALAQDADVIVQNYRPGVAERMGMGWAEMSAKKPGLVYVSVTGWGPSGPMAKVPTVDTTMQAASGIMVANRGADGQPRRVGLFLVDLSTGLYAAQATLAALLRQARTGQGRHVEVSMLHTAAALQSYLVIDAALYPGTESPVNAPGGVFPTRDGKLLNISMLNDAMFKRLAQATGIQIWLDDASLMQTANRLARAPELIATLGARVAEDDLASWCDTLAQHDILFAPVRSPAELPQEPQVQHLKIYAEQVGAGRGSIPLAGLPGGLDVGTLHAAPKLGEHNALLG